jgi:ribonuclease P protein component
LRVRRRKFREKNIPAEQIGAKAPARFSRAYGDEWRPQGHRGPACARAQAAQCVIGDARSAVVVERLKRRSDFRAVGTGARVAGRAFVLQARRRAADGAIRVGFTVSRQVGDAVERNRVRRRLREIVRLSAAAGAEGLYPGLDYVLIGRRAALAAPFGEIMQDFNAALSRIYAKVGRGTGSTSSDPLHEAGSPSRPPQRRRNRKLPSTPSSRPTGSPPHER